MQTSESIGKLAEALAKAQTAIPEVERNRTVKVTTRTGGSYDFRYATLDNIVSKVKQPLSDNGLTFVQALTQDDKGIVLETRLLHASGEWIASTLPLKAEGQGWQALGSAITYAKRYALSAMLGVAADEDDDANTADGNTLEDRPRSKNGRGPDWGKSAGAKRNGDWDDVHTGLIANLSQCETVAAVDHLRRDYVKNTYPKWNRDWQYQADEAFAKRVREIEDEQELSGNAKALEGERWPPRTVPASKQNQGRNDRAPGKRMPFEESAAVGEMLIAAMRAAKTQADLDKWREDNKAQINQLVDEHFYSLKIEYGKLFKRLPESTLVAG